MEVVQALSLRKEPNGVWTVMRGRGRVAVDDPRGRAVIIAAAKRKKIRPSEALVAAHAARKYVWEETLKNRQEVLEYIARRFIHMHKG